ncbi:MAG: NCS2 family permease [Verrucomicrobiales bacterium]|nr:NCS2 family permease [Verrucomicrobiales bacterium]
MSTIRSTPWFVRGDVDGFFGLAIDNLVQILLIVVLCKGVLGFSDHLIFDVILPGVAVSLLVGNLYYGWQARRLAITHGRNDVCALPYGINTVSLIGFVFLVMLPAKLAAERAGAADPGKVAWHVGLFACFGSGVVEFCGAAVGNRIRKLIPRAALLSALAGIALSFVSLGFLFRTFARPEVGLPTLGIVMLLYFSRSRLKGPLPAGLLSVLLGTTIAWFIGYAPIGSPPSWTGLHLPSATLQEISDGFTSGGWKYLGVVLPIALFNLIGSLQNVESAEAAGDDYPTAPSLAVNGLGTLAAAAFGSCFPTTIYVGHPGWKALGSRAGYSVLNGVILTFLILSGLLGYAAWAVPIEAGMAILIWIGMIITAQAFQATPYTHAPAVVMGILPALAAWGAFIAKSALAVASTGATAGAIIEQFQNRDIWIHGAFALEQGFVFTGMILASTTVCLIERRFNAAAGWCCIAAVFSMTGLMHSYTFSGTETNLVWSPAWPWTFGYLCMALSFVVARWVCEPNEDELMGH